MKTGKLYSVPEIKNIKEMLIRSAEEYGDKLALEDLEEHPINKLSFNELHSIVKKFGKALLKAGIKERDHIAVVGENRVQWCITYLSSMYFNLVIVPLDKNSTRNDLFNIIRESNSVAVVYSSTFREMFEEDKEFLPKVRFYIGMDAVSTNNLHLSMKEMIENENDEVVKLPTINETDIAELIYTSGSLGRAKGVMLSQKNLATNLMAMTKMVNIRSTDRFLGVLPIHHTYQCTCGFLCPVYTGASVHFARSLKTIAEDIKNVKATVLLGTPLLFNKIYFKIVKGIEGDKRKAKVVPLMIKISNYLTQAGIKGAKRKIFTELHSKFGGELRLLIAGGAAPDPRVSKGFREFGFTFIQGYGLTETSPILALNRLDNFKDEAAGLPLPGIDLLINKQDSKGAGEVYVRGDSIMLGYYKNEELTADSFEGDWFKTGDIGYIDEDGFLHLCGRKKNVIIANNGENVYPEEIEDLLNRSPYILESIVYAEEDEKHKEIIAVQIVPDQDSFMEYAALKGIEINFHLLKEIITGEIKKLNPELPSYKQIRKIYISEKEFEKTTTLKIKRHLMNEIADEEKMVENFNN